MTRSQEDCSWFSVDVKCGERHKWPLPIHFTTMLKMKDRQPDLINLLERFIFFFSKGIILKVLLVLSCSVETS